MKPLDSTAAGHPRAPRSLPADPSRFRLLMSLYPPLFFSGVRVESVAEDWTRIRVSHRVRPWNCNVNRSAFGGTLFAMTDPFYAVMAAGQLGSGYRIWNIVGGIEFLAPGRGTVSATMELGADQVNEIRDRIRADGHSVTTHTTEIRTADGNVVARASQDLSVRPIRS
ncbi:DUF4442 domain-containing protein [Nocardia sp. NPDC004604]|uniref:PaaI family thioesterase n=1 Tax=Nocardia sp. NPDC004604 TaxID=3157013 RepID=UPI0033AC743A